MNSQTQSLTLPGPAGAIEALLDLPEADLFASPRGTAVIAHPHPQFGGTMTNKVVQTISRACVKWGWRAVRACGCGWVRSTKSHSTLVAR